MGVIRIFWDGHHSLRAANQWRGRVLGVLLSFSDDTGLGESFIKAKLTLLLRLHAD
jgi:hypothetical protein